MSEGLRVGLVAAIGLGLAAFTYLYLERLGRRGVVPLVFRAAAWTALGLLLLDLSCSAGVGGARPLVLLDGSLSLTAAGGRWREADSAARRLGEVRVFGDERPGADTAPDRGRSLLGPALAAAAASARPVIVVTDGEIEDARAIPADLLERAGVRLFPRRPVPDVAITRVSGPSRVTSGDSVRLEVELAATGGARPESLAVAVESRDRRLARRVVRLEGDAGRARLAFASAGLGAGDHVLRVRLVDHADAEPGTDERLHLVTVVPSPAVVLLAAPADWDTRFLYRALKDVARLPVRGYARLERDRWRALHDLTRVAEDQVRQAARRADVLILKGDAGSLGEAARARGIWRWPSGPIGDASPVAGDWYLAAPGGSPLDPGFAGFPIDSFPPAVQLVPMRPRAGQWVALTAQNGRRGPSWPAIVGEDSGRVRLVTVLADGLWRWAFRGGSSEESYRAWVAATLDWLLAAPDTAAGLARPVRPVVQNGRPLVFQWTAPGRPRPIPVEWSPRPPAGGDDTLRFDGSGRAALWLPPGEYRYRLAGGGGGAVAVERYSDELVPRPVVLAPREPRPPAAAAGRSARDRPWLFALCLLALAGEWIARRRLGLR